ncbi:unnamed protein product (macronuclear) [Paramecium tetraurelia]|uniref:Thioredoxin reductase n=1 Tax=Paramecium tetraurelia TaxID=5888 RepID=A0EBY4_PARTE|nr:uncharacterized protein GSPATT00025537001 [Paramecium tetraurelia]CAK92801.1 unnamed protein product [Paramecium tetraurelia]|eukprot:XP_001460198.1 hypothetical protein (macronuclear) [Paramecium tetraurelia strain d4-2]
MKIAFRYSYDLFVIGGGSGGLASSKAAAQLGKKVALADYVVPSPHGQTWGVGGTCVNVGCIPKKMFHFAAQLGDYRQDQGKVGWSGINENGSHDWNKLVQVVSNLILRLNRMHENNLKIAGVQYINSLARLVDPNTIELTDQKGQKSTVTAEKIIVSVGARPKSYEGLDPQNYITSDDLFWMRRPPGKSLIIGGSYVALECAGFLNGLGFDTQVLVRSKLLRKFDQQYAQFVGQYMVERGVKFHYGCTPSKIEGQTVTWKDKNGKEQSEKFDTVLMAISRQANTQNLGLERVGIQTDQDQKIIVNKYDQTSCPNIYAVGDCVSGKLELTPTAIMAGRKLIRRLYQGSSDIMDYRDVATTVFTPLEYSCIGLSEEKAVEMYGKDNLKIFENVFKPVTWNISARNPSICQGKLIVRKDNDQIVGFHYIGPEAAEVTQGFAVAIRMGATKSDFDSTVGIHPSAAEEMVQMKKFR